MHACAHRLSHTRVNTRRSAHHSYIMQHRKAMRAAPDFEVSIDPVTPVIGWRERSGVYWKPKGAAARRAGTRPVIGWKMSNGGHCRDGYGEAEAAESEGEQDEDDVYTKGSLRGAAVRLERRLCAFYMSSHMYRGTRDVCVRVHL